MNRFIQPYIGVLRSGGISIVLLLLFVPDDVFNFTSIAHFSTPENITYKWLDSSASLLFIPLFILVLFSLGKPMRKANISLFVFFVALLTWNLVKASFVESYLISNWNFELFYGFLIGILILMYLDTRLKSLYQKELFFELFILLQIISLIIGVATGVKVLGGRYHAANLDVGTTGLFLGVFLTYLLFVKENVNYFLVFIIFICIFLTGSRTNLILPLLFILLYIWKNRRKFISGKLIFLSPIFFLVALYLSSNNIRNLQVYLEFIDFDRIIAFYEMIAEGNISNDDSFIGRLNSLIVGLKVLDQNPFGTFFSFIDLQWNMQLNDYPTFPHNSILAFYLVLGPLFLYVIATFLYTYHKLIVKESTYRYIFLYIILYSIIGGGLFVNFKIFFFYLLLFTLGKQASLNIKMK